MYKVRYYLSGGTLVSKKFETLHDATMFAVFQTPFRSVYSIDKIK